MTYLLTKENAMYRILSSILIRRVIGTSPNHLLSPRCQILPLRLRGFGQRPLAFLVSDKGKRTDKNKGKEKERPRLTTTPARRSYPA